MPIPSNVARRLREVLGKEAGEDLVTWIDETSAVRADLAELRHEMQAGFARVEARCDRLALDLASRIDRVQIDSERLRLDMSSKMSRLETEVTALARLHADLAGQFQRFQAEVTAQIERSRADLIKWSFVFWVGAVTAIAALARVLG